MKNILCLLAIIFISGCINDPKEGTHVIESKDVTDNVTIQDPENKLGGCYVSILKRDSANLNLIIKNNYVSGTLEYKLYEKDRNNGTISGKYEDSLIVLNYTFQSEGISSIREVVFKVVNGELLEGQGLIEMKGDTAKFKDISKLIYPEEYRFKKTDCP
jgi:hypothetical protein